MFTRHRIVLVGLSLVGVGWAWSLATSRDRLPDLPLPEGGTASVSVDTASLARIPCSGAFVEHRLDFSTLVDGERVSQPDSNGAGVAVGDLDGDGRPDIVLANLDGADAIFWNEGGFRFTRQAVDDRASRAVNTIDVDSDGAVDIVFTHRAGGVSFWHNVGSAAAPRAFRQETLPGVVAPAYSMAWADLGRDGALDLVTASYDAELDRVRRNAFLFSNGAGVYYYERVGPAFVPHRLSPSAQALAIALPDLNQDGRRDLLVGSDFNEPDQVWLRSGTDWVPSPAALATTTENTMSYDEGDVDNDGRPELLATDMKPFAIDTRTLASWLPLMATMPQKHDPGDPQVMANVLQVRGADDRLHDEARARGIDATGWSWSGKFGDLDNDGFLDLYVVNGMIDAETMGHLPGDELVEQNQAFHNAGDGTFSPAPDWGLATIASGRGMSMSDFNGDGRLDVVINNLRSPAQVFENGLCGGDGVEVDLRWPQSSNTRAIGANLALRTDAGTLRRDVRVGSGYLSGDPARVHFGVPSGAHVGRLEIQWPDGAASVVAEPRSHALLTVSR